MVTLKRNEDGTTHINVWSRARTELGQLLSNFALLPFTHPTHGCFASVEGLWYWLATGQTHSQFKRLYGFSAKSLGKRLPTVQMDVDAFRSEIKTAIRCKVEQTPRLKHLFTESILPFEHYYVFNVGAENEHVRDTRDKHGWQMEYLEQLRDELRVAAGLSTAAEARAL